MTINNTGTTLMGRMPAKIVSKDDPEKMGRLKIRFMDQSESDIPDNKLSWSIPEGQTSGGGPSMFLLGIYFVGQWVEAERMGDLGYQVQIHKIISAPGKKK